MSDISVSEISDIVTAKRNRFDAFGIPVDCDLDETEAGKPYAFSDINIRILYLVHGKTMWFDIPHCDTESTDPSRSGDRYDFAPSCFDADGSWKLFPKWVSDRIEHECGMFPVDGANGYINISDISVIWHSVNGNEYGRPAWLDEAEKEEKKAKKKKKKAKKKRKQRELEQMRKYSKIYPDDPE